MSLWQPLIIHVDTYCLANLSRNVFWRLFNILINGTVDTAWPLKHCRFKENVRTMRTILGSKDCQAIGNYSDNNHLEERHLYAPKNKTLLWRKSIPMVQVISFTIVYKLTFQFIALSVDSLRLTMRMTVMWREVPRIKCHLTPRARS